MEVDRISYIFGSFSRRRQSQDLGSAKRRSIEPPKISHDRSNSTPHTTRRNEQPSHRTKSVYDVPFDENKFRCPICQRYYVDPRVLPCLHTFCIRCLREMEARSSISLDKNSDGMLYFSSRTVQCDMHVAIVNLKVNFIVNTNSYLHLECLSFFEYETKNIYCPIASFRLHWNIPYSLAFAQKVFFNVNYSLYHKFGKCYHHL